MPDAIPDALDFFRGQPYPVWEEARRAECPVIAGGGMSLGPSTTYQVTRYHDAELVLRDGETFSFCSEGCKAKFEAESEHSSVTG